MLGLGWHPVDSMLTLYRGAGAPFVACPQRSCRALGRTSDIEVPSPGAFQSRMNHVRDVSRVCLGVILARIEESQVEGPDAAQDEKRCATVGTRHLRRGGGGASRLFQGGAGVGGNHLADGVGGDATGGVHKAEVAPLHEACRQDMWEEAAHKLKDIEAGGAWTG